MANIRRARRSGLVLRGGRNVRETAWIGLTETSTTLAAASTASITNVTGAGLLAERPFTIVRARYFVYVQSDQVAATELFQTAFGACVVSDQSVAIGPTAVPTPFTDKDSDAWFVYEIFTDQFVTGAGNSSKMGIGREVDSRAMRKVEEGFQLIHVVENSTISNGSIVTIGGRVLIKLH